MPRYPDARRWAAGSRRSIPALWTVEHALRWCPAAASAGGQPHGSRLGGSALRGLFGPAFDTARTSNMPLSSLSANTRSTPAAPPPAAVPALSSQPSAVPSPDTPTQLSPAQAGGAGQARHSRGARLRAPEDCFAPITFSSLSLLLGKFPTLGTYSSRRRRAVSRRGRGRGREIRSYKRQATSDKRQASSVKR